MSIRFVAHVSGHSGGATQNLAALDIDLAAITQAGGGVRRECRCGMRRSNAARSGMGRAARKGPQPCRRRSDAREFARQMAELVEGGLLGGRPELEATPSGQSRP
jgi:hypothetical protein